jgi:peptidoglycan/LPS O-acetylase OafA/YrhL
MNCEMQANLPPCTTASGAPVSRGAVCILTGGTICLGVIAAVVCGFAYYNNIGGTSFDDFIVISLMHGVPLLLLSCIGIPAGMLHLRRRSILPQISSTVYVVALSAVAISSLSGDPLVRWFSIFLICCIVSMVVSIRTASRYQHAYDR